MSRNLRRLSIALAVFAVGTLLVFGVMLLRERSLRAIEADQRARAAKYATSAVAHAKESGNTYVFYWEMLTALAADEECREKVTSLEFSLGREPFDEPFDYSVIRQLTNLKRIYFYCGGSEQALKAAQGMESIEEFSFELCGSSPEEIEMLATFPKLKKVSYSQVMRQSTIDHLKELLPGVDLRGYDDAELIAGDP
ncbi:hypothetical protein [Aeoliella mucimassa]|uniref:Leucine Rich repeats (2 copies) n=1 Tax=Aeoliella mucimassa TaxID=2527972 RepID=A0A518AQT2_9BACT|nr:hypothetical protein [Aeoliella mucimassa]QDU57092.1 hypothetical protein Pan181_33060 [Aeoliella mucimassa]